MTPRQAALVKQSFMRVFPAKAKLTVAFYERLFALAPDVRPMFSDDMRTQREMLGNTLAYMVKHLDKLDEASETAAILAKRHVRYGVEPHHFAVVGMALLQALQDCTPAGLTEAETGAWTAAFETLSDLMIKAAWPEGQDMAS
ncbi:MAG: globin domain-containing protein [Pseudomonadota bacterium]